MASCGMPILPVLIQEITEQPVFDTIWRDIPSDWLPRDNACAGGALFRMIRDVPVCVLKDVRLKIGVAIGVWATVAKSCESGVLELSPLIGEYWEANVVLIRKCLLAYLLIDAFLLRTANPDHLWPAPDPTVVQIAYRLEYYTREVLQGIRMQQQRQLASVPSLASFCAGMAGSGL